MRLLLFFVTILFSFTLTWAQTVENRESGKPSGLDIFIECDLEKTDSPAEISAADSRPPEIETAPKQSPATPVDSTKAFSKFDPVKFSPLKADFDSFSKFKPKRFFEKPKQYDGGDKFHWRPAITESLVFLGIQHGFRMMQEKTKKGLKGPFFPDWAQSAKNLGGWRDGDSFMTNYIAHPMQGSATGRIFINNSEVARRQVFGKSKSYWKSRFKAMAWSAVWSVQFELGPISEASIGNVGLDDKTGPNRMGWVDLAVTPTAGTAVLIGEDMIDRFVLKNWLERKLRSRTKIKIFRTFFTPIHSFMNVLGGRVPWKRYNR